MQHFNETVAQVSGLDMGHTHDSAIIGHTHLPYSKAALPPAAYFNSDKTNGSL